MTGAFPALPLRAARDRFLYARGSVAPAESSADAITGLREEISASWHRSIASGLRPDNFDVPYIALGTVGSLLQKAAGPVADGLGADLSGTGVSLLLADRDALIVNRWVPDHALIGRLDRVFLAPGYLYGEENAGTNAIAMALRQDRAVLVVGEEHFADTLTVMACAAAPVTDPRTGRILGALTLTCQREMASSLMVTVVKRASREIERQLIDGTPLADRGLLELFLRARRRAKGPLVLVNARTILTNTAAASLLQPPDHQLLWEWTSRIRPRKEPVPSQLRLTSGLVVSARARRIEEGGTVIAALLRLDPLNVASATDRQPNQSPAGWASLTDAERSVAAVVADGATNREAAARLYISRHTVDYYLRQIFRKLGITSRVELARLAMQQAAFARQGIAPAPRPPGELPDLSRCDS